MREVTGKIGSRLIKIIHNTLIDMFFDIFLFILLGLFLRVVFTVAGVSSERIDLLRDRINYFVFYYIIPFVCFKTSYTMPFSLGHLKVSLVANLTITSSVIISWLIYKKIAHYRNIRTEVIGSLIMCSSFGNVLYIGLPVITRLYGEQGMSYAFTYDFLASTPLTWTLAVAVSMKYGSAKSFTLKNSVLTIIKIPAIWGLIAGLIFKEIAVSMPEVIVDFLKEISSFVTYLMLIIVGISIKAVYPRKILISLPAVLIKLFVSPLFAFVFGSLVGLSEIPLKVCIIDAGTPSMLLSMIFATAFGLDLKTAIEMIFLTTLIFLSIALVI